MMRVNLHPGTRSTGVLRTATALAGTLPEGWAVAGGLTGWIDNSPEQLDADADLAVLHVVGRHDAVRARAEKLLEAGTPFAVVQYCVRSTKAPRAQDWTWLWDRARCVWSYYDLEALCAEDGCGTHANHYCAPLGVSRALYGKINGRRSREYAACTSGLDWLTESVREVVLAAQAVDPQAFVLHLGPELGREGVRCVQDLPDPELGELYRQCARVSGLRRIEGFELPAAEALCCGTRPVLFDRPHYRRWYGGWAEYVEERTRPEVQEQLTALFRTAPRPVARDERDAARKRFDWSASCGQYWARVQGAL